MAQITEMRASADKIDSIAAGHGATLRHEADTLEAALVNPKAAPIALGAPAEQAPLAEQAPPGNEAPPAEQAPPSIPSAEDVATLALEKAAPKKRRAVSEVGALSSLAPPATTKRLRPPAGAMDAKRTEIRDGVNRVFAVDRAAADVAADAAIGRMMVGKPKAPPAAGPKPDEVASDGHESINVDPEDDDEEEAAQQAELEEVKCYFEKAVVPGAQDSSDEEN